MWLETVDEEEGISTCCVLSPDTGFSHLGTHVCTFGLIDAGLIYPRFQLKSYVTMARDIFGGLSALEVPTISQRKGSRSGGNQTEDITYPDPSVI